VACGKFLNEDPELSKLCDEKTHLSLIDITDGMIWCINNLII
jgi:hypothetical protein